MPKPTSSVTDWITIGIGILGLSGLAGGLIWLGSISSKLDQHSKAIEELSKGATRVESGPRGRSCENIVNRLGVMVERGDTRAQQELERIAGEWGCAAMEVSHDLDGNAMMRQRPGYAIDPSMVPNSALEH